MTSSWYKVVRVWIKTALWFSYDEISVNGKSHFPDKGPVIVVANHQNTLIDPLLIACFLPRAFHFLLRASFFSGKAAHIIAEKLNMMPIYRPRDGVNVKEKNQEVFDQCVQLLSNNQCLLIFPEGSHLGKYTLRPFQKGFARIAEQFLKENSESLTILPIGLNYFKLDGLGNRVFINVGKGITLKANQLDQGASFLNALKQQTEKQLSELIINFPLNDEYTTKEKQVKELFQQSAHIKTLWEAAKQTDFPNNIKLTETTQKHRKKWWKICLTPLHIIPHVVAKPISVKAKDQQFQPAIYLMVSLITHTILWPLVALVIWVFY